MTWTRKIDIDDLLNRGRSRGHDQDAIGKLHCFFNVVGDKQDGFLFALPEQVR